VFQSLFVGLALQVALPPWAIGIDRNKTAPLK